MRFRTGAGLAIVALAVAACAEGSGPAAPEGPSLALIANPGVAQGERVIVCKAGGVGTFDFTFAGTDYKPTPDTAVAGNFSLQPGQCWQIGVFGAEGVVMSITETPATGYQVASIAVDQFVGADQLVTGTNTVSNVLASGTVRNGALVTFTNELIPPPPPPPGDQGCTPGYWKQEQHLDSWQTYVPTDLFSGVFGGYTTLSSSLTLRGALNLGGGSGVAGAERNLARAATASLLNAESNGVTFPLATAAVITQVNAAFATQDRTAMLSLAGVLDGYNNYGCPLN